MSFQLPQVFDARSVEPSSGGSNQLPVSDSNGWPVVIINSDVVPVKDKPNAAFIRFDLMIIDGEHKGAEGTYRVNYFSDSEVAANIAKGQLSALGHVTGQFSIANTAQLHNIPFRVVVGLQKDKESAEKGFTEIKYVLDINGNKAGKSGAQAVAAPTPSPTPAPAPQPAPAPAPGGWAPPAEAATQAAPPWGQPAGGAAPASPPWATKP